MTHIQSHMHLGLILFHCEGELYTMTDGSQSNFYLNKADAL